MRRKLYGLRMPSRIFGTALTRCVGLPVQWLLAWDVNVVGSSGNYTPRGSTKVGKRTQDPIYPLVDRKELLDISGPITLIQTAMARKPSG